jgi:transcriptional antiterminator/mannitol/fructose-specific phosphotransferase system IIA component (Ntr-type)
MFEKIDVEEIEKIIKHLEKQLNVHFADTAFAGLMIHIAIAIERLRRNEKIEMPIEQLQNLQKTQEFLRLKDLMKVVESTYKITIPDTEIGYITVHVLGAKLRDHFHNDNKAMTVQNDEKIIEIIDLFIRQVSIDLHTDLSKDFELRKGLYVHIRPALERLKYGLENHNPLLDDIFKYYLAIFEICSVRIKVFEEAFTVIFNTDEIGYIVLHIGSALERLNEQPINQAIRVIIVCGSGIGTAKMLSSRIRKELPELEVIAELSVLELDDPAMDRADYIISSITISRSLKIPCINVSPLLTVEDMNELRRIFGRHDHSYNKTKSQYETLMEIIAKNCQIIDDQQLQRDLFSFLNGDSILTQWGLMDFLNAFTITCKIEANNLEEAIRQTAQPLLKRKWIENNYVKRVIKNCKRLPQHFVLMQGLVMPHAETGNDVLRTSMSLGVLKEPVTYGDFKISVILLLAVRENNYEKAMEEVLIILEDEALIQKLTDCDKGDEVTKVISNILDQSE